MNQGTRRWSRLVDWLHAPEPGTSVAVFRICIGLCVLITIGSVVWADLVDVIWVDGAVRRLKGNWLVRALGGPTAGVVWSLVAIALVSGSTLALGLLTRVSALVALLSTQALVDMNSYAGGSYDQLLQNGLWLAFLTPAGHTLSLDCKLRTGTWHHALPIGRWARWLIAFQIVLVYTSTGWQKLSAYWTPGGDFSALYYIMQQPSWQHGDMRWLARIFPLTQLGTAVSWFWEVLNPLWLLALFQDERGHGWLHRLHIRHVFLTLGVVFHGLILLTMNVGPFAPISLAFYVALLLPDGVHRRFTPRSSQVHAR